MSQTSYNVNMDIAFEGMLADSKEHDALSKITEDATMEFGLGCALGTSDNQVATLADITDKFAGVIIHRHREEGELGAQVSVAVLRKGRIYVKVEEAVVAGDPVFVRAVVAGAERAGAFRKSADSTDCIDLTGKAEFVTSADAGGFAVLDLNLPG